MNRRIIGSLYKKEMLDVLRDKKTVLMMIVIPIILYPLLFIVGIQFITSITKNIETNTYKVAFSYDVEQELYEQFYKVNASQTEDDEKYSFKIYEMDNCKQALSDGNIDAYVEKIERDGKPEYIIHYMSSVNNSNYCATKVAEILDKYSYAITTSIVKEHGLDVDSVLNPISIKYQNMSTNEESAGSILATILPTMLIFSLLLGTMYPAIDTTAGERERGTLETVLTLPITNRQLIFCKFLAVSTIGIVTALLNIISMSFVGAYIYNVVNVTGNGSGVDMTKYIPAIVVGILCVIAFAIFMSAITMCVCAFAKTYKEANNYITPLTLVIMFASFIQFLPNVVLTQKMAVVPVANICLLIRDILCFKFDIGIIAIVLVSNAAYGIIAVLFLSKIYNSESVLFGDGRNTTLVFEKRSNMIRGGVPSTGDAWLVIAVTAVMIIYAGGFAQLEYGMLGVIITQLIIVGIPIAAAIYSKKNLKETFRIKKTRGINYVAAVIMMAGAIMIGVVISAVAGSIFKESGYNVDISMESLIGDSFAVTLIIVAILPAICEELMFRGYILSAMEKGMKPKGALLLSAALFGIYHMSIVKFFTTGFLGLVICYVAYKTKSIFAGMVMHFINNGLSCVILYYPEQMEKVLPIISQDKLSVVDTIVLVVAGATLLVLGKHIITNEVDKKCV